MTHDATLDAPTYDRITVGDSREDLAGLLPRREATRGWTGRLRAAPDGSLDCHFYSDGNYPAAFATYRLCAPGCGRSWPRIPRSRWWPEAGDGREAVDLVYRHRPDVALLDVRMPPGRVGGRGGDRANRARDRRRHAHHVRGGHLHRPGARRRGQRIPAQVR